MAFKRILIFQANLELAKPIAKYFSTKGAKVRGVNTRVKGQHVLKNDQPDLVFVDLHVPESDLLGMIDDVQKIRPEAKIIITNEFPDLRKEMLVRERGIDVFLREPFTPVWIDKALGQVSKSMDESADKVNNQPDASSLPKVRMPMSLKITLPYAILALIFALGATYLVSRYVLESFRDRFTAQLIDAGKLTSDWMVQEEDRILETLRLIAHTEGVAKGIQEGNSEYLHEILLPIAVNYAEESIVILDHNGVSLLSLNNDPSQSGEYTVSKLDNSYSEFEFVQKVLLREFDEIGDKYAGISKTAAGSYFHISGPIYDTDGNQVGVVIVGKSLEGIVEQIRRDTLAHISIYGLDGTLLATTLFLYPGRTQLLADFLDQVISQQDEESLIREFDLGSASYSEIIGVFEARGGTDLGIVGIALAHNFILRPTIMTALQTTILVVGAFLLIVLLGVLLARQITQPLSDVVRASVRVATGDLETKVPTQGNDEAMVLAHAFNYMVSGLQEGVIYRDLLGRTVSPQVREALRTSFATGDLKLDGQTSIASVLMSDIHGFTTLSEQEEPTKILKWLNEYFSEIVPVITKYGGVVDKFEGDAMLAFFGILPKPIPASESAYQSCQAAIEMLEVIDNINARRESRGEPQLITGIGINSGGLTAGGLGTADRLNYTIIGDSVNTTQRLEGVTRQFGQSGIVISEHTLGALSERREDFRVEPLGEFTFRGKQDLIWLYRLYPLQRNGEDNIDQ
jgi:adenylate cyclase